jgi:hypothetical protein
MSFESEGEKNPNTTTTQTKRNLCGWKRASGSRRRPAARAPGRASVQGTRPTASTGTKYQGGW